MNPENPMNSDKWKIAGEPIVEPAETMSHDKHFAFDWNGWGIGTEAEPFPPARLPGESVAAWRLGVRTIADGY